MQTGADVILIYYPLHYLLAFSLFFSQMKYRVVYFTGTPPKSSKYKIKFQYQDWYPPKTLVSASR